MNNSRISFMSPAYYNMAFGDLSLTPKEVGCQFEARLTNEPLWHITASSAALRLTAKFPELCVAILSSGTGNYHVGLAAPEAKTIKAAQRALKKFPAFISNMRSVTAIRAKLDAQTANMVIGCGA